MFKVDYCCRLWSGRGHKLISYKYTLSVCLTPSSLQIMFTSRGVCVCFLSLILHHSKDSTQKQLVTLPFTSVHWHHLLAISLSLAHELCADLHPRICLLLVDEQVLPVQWIRFQFVDPESRVESETSTAFFVTINSDTRKNTVLP